MRFSKLNTKKRKAKEKAKALKIKRAILKESKNLPKVIDFGKASDKMNCSKMPEGYPLLKVGEDITKPLDFHVGESEVFSNSLSPMQEEKEQMPKVLEHNEEENRIPLVSASEEEKGASTKPLGHEKDEIDQIEEGKEEYVNLTIAEVERYLDKLETITMQKNLSSIFESLKKGKRKGTFAPLSAIPEVAVDNYKASRENRKGCRTSVYCLVKDVKRVLLRDDRHLTILRITDESIFPQYCIAKMYSEQRMEIESNWIIKLAHAKSAIVASPSDKSSEIKILVPRLFWSDIFGSYECFDSCDGRLLAECLASHSYRNNKKSYEARFGQGISQEVVMKLQRYAALTINESEYQAVNLETKEVGIQLKDAKSEKK
jgi:hypothetical protein